MRSLESARERRKGRLGGRPNPGKTEPPLRAYGCAHRRCLYRALVIFDQQWTRPLRQPDPPHRTIPHRRLRRRRSHRAQIRRRLDGEVLIQLESHLGEIIQNYGCRDPGPCRTDLTSAHLRLAAEEFLPRRHHLSLLYERAPAIHIAISRQACSQFRNLFPTHSSITYTPRLPAAPNSSVTLESEATSL